jgi:ABC-2 type transport system permease protein
MGNDKRTLALMILAPVLILSLLYLLLGEGTYVPKIAVDESFPAPLLTELKKLDVTVTSLAYTLDTDKSADDLLINHSEDAVLIAGTDGIHIRMLDSGSSKAASITRALKDASASLSPSSAMNLSYVYGNGESTTFNSLGYVLLGVLSFFFVFIISGISFVRERETGTLGRLMATPIRRISVVGGYTLGFGILSALQSALIILYSRYVLGMEFKGSVWLAIIIMMLLAFTAVSIGAFVSIFANNEFQVMQFIPLIVVPQMFFSGLITLDTLPYGLGKLAYFMPIYYGCSGLEKVLIKGFGIGDVWQELGMLLVFILIFFVLNVMALKKYRKL